MEDAPDSVVGEGPPPRAWVKYVLLGFCLMVIHAALTRYLVPEVLEGTLVGTDGYSRMLRVGQLQETGSWFGNLIPQMNAPYGMELHWTRPLDIILLVSGWLLSPFTGFKGGLLWSGIILSPAFHVISCLALVWAVRPIIGAEGRPMVALVFLAQPILIVYAQAGRADHHMLLILTYVLSLGCFFRLIYQPETRWPALTCGAMAGFGLWVSIEFLIPLLSLLAALTLLWLLGDSRVGRSGFRFSVGLVGVVGLALVAEHPVGRLFVPEYDRISAPHLILSFLAMVFWFFARTCGAWGHVRDSILSRTVILFLAAVVSSGTLFMTYPGILSNPMTDVNPDFWDLFIRHIEELQPLFPGNLSEVGRTVIFLGSAVLTIPYSVWLLLPRHEEITRAAWLPVAIGLCAFIPLGLYQIRMSIWAGVPVAIGLGSVLFTMNQRLGHIRKGSLRALVRVTLSAGIIVGPLVIGGGLSYLLRNQLSPSERSGIGDCSVAELSSALWEGVYGETPRVLLTGPNIGPELVYRTHHLVVASPYHRNESGILDTYEAMVSTDDSFSLGILRDRGVDLVVLCPSRDGGFFQQVDASDQTLFARLVEGRGPAWLQSLDLPGLPDTEFLVFEVTEG